MTASIAEILNELETIIKTSKEKDPTKSYTASLFNGGVSRIAKKVGEEGVEVALAAMEQDKEHLTSEIADLMFHLLVLLEHEGLSFTEVASELERRLGISGLDEKAARK